MRIILFCLALAVLYSCVGCAVNAGRDFGVEPKLNLEVPRDLGK